MGGGGSAGCDPAGTSCDEGCSGATSAGGASSPASVPEGGAPREPPFPAYKITPGYALSLNGAAVSRQSLSYQPGRKVSVGVIASSHLARLVSRRGCLVPWAVPRH